MMERVNLFDEGYVELIDHLGDDLTVVNAARVSFNRESEEFAESDYKLIKYLLKNKHTSPFEHVVFTFKVKCPIFVARQWMRHRTWSYNEVSRRYTSENISFYHPTVWRKQSEDNKQASEGEFNPNSYLGKLFDREYANLLELSENLYNNMLRSGVAREMARMVLPVSLYTTFVATVDLHNLLHFIQLRDHAHAQAEIAGYAQAMKILVGQFVPNTLKAWLELENEN